MRHAETYAIEGCPMRTKAGPKTRAARTAAMLCIAALLGIFATTVSFAEEAGGNAAPDPGSAKPQDPDTSGKGTGPGSNNAGNAGDNGGNKGGDHDMRNGGRSGAPPSSANAKGGNTGPNPGAKSGGVVGHGGIDLVTPDNGYTNLRRRAQRKALVAIAAKKHATPGSIATNNPNFHPAPGTVTGIGQSRNAIGMPMTTGVAGVGHHGPGFMHPGTTGVAGIGAPLHPPTFHVNVPPPIHITGINGTTMGHVGPGTIGGPANIHTGVNGTTLRRKY
jgi:hypothetical protein